MPPLEPPRQRQRVSALPGMVTRTVWPSHQRAWLLAAGALVARANSGADPAAGGSAGLRGHRTRDRGVVATGVIMEPILTGVGMWGGTAGTEDLVTPQCALTCD